MNLTWRSSGSDRIQDGFLLASAFTAVAVALLAARSGSGPHDRDGSASGVPDDSALEVPGPAAAGTPVLIPEISTVTDAEHVSPDWLVLDGPARRIYRLDASGRVTDAFGGEGDGPGEFHAPVAVAAVGDTVVVAEAGGARLHLLDRKGKLLRRIVPAVPGCRAPFLLDAEGSDAGVVLLLRCPKGRAATTDVAAVVRAGGAVRVLGRSPGPGIGADRSVFSRPLLAARGSLVALGRQDRRCLQVVTLRADAEEAPQERCFPPRTPIPLDPETRSSLRAHFDGLEARTGVRARIPDDHPPLYDLHVAGGEPVAVVPAPGDRLELVVLGGGTPALSLEPWHGVHMSGTSILQFREELHGVRVRTLRFPLR